MSNRRKIHTKHSPQRRSPLPLLLIAGGVLLLIAGVVFSLSLGNNRPAGTPRLQVGDIQASPQAATEGLKIDFGDLQLGAQNAILEIRLTNNGNGLLQFTEAPYIELAAGC